MISVLKRLWGKSGSSSVPTSKDAAADFLNRFFDFASDPHRILPEKPWENFLKRGREVLNDEEYQKWTDELKKNNYKDILNVLFAAEFSYPYQYSPKTQRIGHGFYRGKGDISGLKKSGKTPLDIAQRYERRAATLNTLLPQGIISEVSTVCEIGGAWGSTMKYLMDRFSPKQYYNFEIDGQYAQWTADHLGSITMPTDGETLAGIDDNSIDITACIDVLPWVAPLKIFSYFSEFARVTKRGGIILFNVHVGDILNKQIVQQMLISSFPRRAYAHVPRSFVTTNFPTDHFEILHEASNPAGGPDKVEFVIRRI